MRRKIDLVGDGIVQPEVLEKVIAVLALDKEYIAQFLH